MMAKGVYLGSPSGYGWMDYDPERLKKTIDFAVDKFEVSVPQMPDAIAFTGSSGAAIAFPLALRYKLPLIMVRKPHEDSHGYFVDCNYAGLIKNFMIVDDFVCTGKTVRQILAKIAIRSRRNGDRPPTCIGIYQWCSGGRDGFRGFGRQTIPMYIPHRPDPDDYTDSCGSIYYDDSKYNTANEA